MSPKERASRAYEALHEGQKPEAVERIRWQAPPKWVVPLGRLKDVVYELPTPRGEEPCEDDPKQRCDTYHHHFKPSARPLLVRDEAGRLRAPIGGNYTVNERGIVDMKRYGGHEHERNESFKSFVTGKHNPRGGGHESEATVAGKVILSGALFAGIVKFLTAIIPGVNTLSPTWQGAGTGLLGIVGGAIARRRFPIMGLAVMGAGGALIAAGIMEDFRVQNALRQLAHPAPGSSSAPPSSSQNPAQGLSGIAGPNPAAAPYDVRTASSCTR